MNDDWFGIWAPGDYPAATMFITFLGVPLALSVWGLYDLFSTGATWGLWTFPILFAMWRWLCVGSLVMYLATGEKKYLDRIA